MMTGNYDTRDELVAAIKRYYDDNVTMTNIASRCGVTLKCVRGIIAKEVPARQTRPIVDPVPMSIKPHELVLVADPCRQHYCDDQGCPWHYAGARP